MAKLVYSAETKKKVHETILREQAKAKLILRLSIGLNVLLSVIIIGISIWEHLNG